MEEHGAARPPCGCGELSGRAPRRLDSAGKPAVSAALTHRRATIGAEAAAATHPWQRSSGTRHGAVARSERAPTASTAAIRWDGGRGAICEAGLAPALRAPRAAVVFGAMWASAFFPCSQVTTRQWPHYGEPMRPIPTSFAETPPRRASIAMRSPAAT